MDNKRDLSPVVTQADPEDWVNETDIGHNAALDNINACLSVTVLSYEEAVKSYLRDRGIGIDKSGELRFTAHRTASTAALKARLDDALILLNELIERPKSREFYGIGPVLFAKLATIKMQIAAHEGDL